MKERQSTVCRYYLKGFLSAFCSGSLLSGSVQLSDSANIQQSIAEHTCRTRGLSKPMHGGANYRFALIMELTAAL